LIWQTDKLTVVKFCLCSKNQQVMQLVIANHC